MKQVDRLEAGAHRPFPAPAFHVQRRGVPGVPGDTLASAAGQWPAFRRPQLQYHRPRGIVAAGWKATPSCSSKPGHTACRMRAPPRSRLYRPDGIQRECGTVAGARPPGHQPAAGALPARRLLLQDLHVAAPPVAPYEARIRAAAGLGSAPDARDAERYDKRYARCAVVGRRTGGIGGRRRGARPARVILVDEQRELGGSLLSARPRSTASRHCAGPGASRRACGSGDVRILTRGTPGPQPGDRRPAADRSSAGADARGFARAAGRSGR